MGLVLAGQGRTVHRDLPGHEAFFPVLVLQDLHHAADQISLLVIAVFCVAVEDDLRLPAGQHRGFLLGAGQLLFPGVAFFPMGVVGFPAGQRPGYPVAFFPVAVVGAFLQTADALPGLGPTLVCMDMQPANQGALPPGAAVFPVAVAWGVAVFIVDVGLHFPQGAAQVPGAVIAVFLMGMYQEIGIAADQIVILVIAPFCVLMELGGAGKGGLLPGRYLGVALRAVGMLRDGAALFQGDGREDQGIGGAKYH